MRSGVQNQLQQVRGCPQRVQRAVRVSSTAQNSTDVVQAPRGSWAPTFGEPTRCYRLWRCWCVTTHLHCMLHFKFPLFSKLCDRVMGGSSSVSQQEKNDLDAAIQSQDVVFFDNSSCPYCRCQLRACTQLYTAFALQKGRISSQASRHPVHASPNRAV